MINKERVVQRFLEYIKIDSPTKEEREFAEFLKKELIRLGLEVYMDNAGEKVGSNSGNLVARLKANADGGKTILFSCHMDTVSPSRGIKPLIKDGVIYSDGTTILGGDDKAGIAAIMEALETIIENNILHGEIEIIFTIFEEGGLFGSKNLDYSKVNAKIGFVLDSGDDPGTIIVQGPAQNKIGVKFIGKEAHAGVCPETGISAIQIASEAISKMNLLRIDEETTANIGCITGGSVTNIVTREVDIISEARSLDNDKLKKQTDHMVKCCEDAAEKFGGKVIIKVVNAYDAFKIDRGHEVVKVVELACNNLGLRSIIATSGGGSDTNILNANGIAAVNLGIGAKKPHTLEEQICIKDLEITARLVLEIINIHAK